MNFPKYKALMIIGMVIIACILLSYFVYNAKNFGDELKKVSSSSKKVSVCKLRQQLTSDQCIEIDLVGIAEGVSRGGPALPPSKAKIKAEYLLVFYDKFEKKSCFLLIDYENDNLNLIVNDIVPKGNCTGISKYRASYYELDKKVL
jgi:hypothetical protein